ncbi:SRPBCC family protein [Streptomyces sp. NPDC001002]
MAVQHRLIKKSPEAVWKILSDAERYGDWVVGTSRADEAEGQWPELEADSGSLGTARIAMELRPWGVQTLLILDEHPLRGAGGVLHNRLLDMAQLVRGRAMLARLARLCEEAEGPARATRLRP